MQKSETVTVFWRKRCTILIMVLGMGQFMIKMQA